MCKEHSDEYTTEINLHAKLSGSGTTGFKVIVVFCHQSPLLNQELLKQVLNANDVPLYTAEAVCKTMQTGSANTKVQTVLHKWLHLHTNKLQLLQNITDEDEVLCFNSATCALVQRAQDADYLPFTHAHTNGRANRQNCYIWGTENPSETIPHIYGLLKINVWHGLPHNKVTGPLFLF